MPDMEKQNAKRKEMAKLVTIQQYNWMSHHGAESKEIDNAHFRPEEEKGARSYDNREGMRSDIRKELQALKDRLGLYDGDDGFAAGGGLSRRELEELRRRQEEEERLRQEKIEADRAARQKIIDEQLKEKKERDATLAGRKEALRESGMSDENEETAAKTSAILASIKRTEAEKSEAAVVLSKGVRMLLLAKGAVYYSYLDGSVKFTIEELEKYNADHRQEVEEQLVDTGLELPSAEEFDLFALRELAEKRNEQMKRANEGDSAASKELGVTKKTINAERQSYNQRAQECAGRVTMVLASKASVPVEEAEEEHQVEEEQQEEAY